jgi:hypothetical protein
LMEAATWVVNGVAQVKMSAARSAMQSTRAAHFKGRRLHHRSIYTLAAKFPA